MALASLPAQRYPAFASPTLVSIAYPPPHPARVAVVAVAHDGWLRCLDALSGAILGSLRISSSDSYVPYVAAVAPVSVRVLPPSGIIRNWRASCCAAGQLLVCCSSGQVSLISVREFTGPQAVQKGGAEVTLRLVDSRMVCGGVFASPVAVAGVDWPGSAAAAAGDSLPGKGSGMVLVGSHGNLLHGLLVPLAP